MYTAISRKVVGCSCPTEHISSFVDSPLQPIAQKQESYLKDNTNFINFIENTQISNDVILATLDVSYLYTNIPQTEGIDVICHHYEKDYEHNLPISTNSYGNFYGSYSKRIISNLMKDTSYKHKVSLWELRWQLLSLLFLWQT